MLQVQNLKMYHKKTFQLLIDEGNFIIHPGEKIALIGAEGSGKSSLLRWLSGEGKPSPYVTIQGDLINHFSRVLYLSQLAPLELLEQSLNTFLYEDDVEHVDYNELFTLAPQFGIDLTAFELERPLSSLSGGEQLKVRLLKLLAQRPDLLLLDEPSNDLDLQTIDRLIHYLQTASVAVLFVSHDTYLLEQTAEKVIHLEQALHRDAAPFSFSALPYEEYVEQRKSQREHQLQVALKEREEDAERVKTIRKLKQQVQQALNATNSCAGGRILKESMAVLKARDKRFARERENFTALPDREELIQIPLTDPLPLAHKELLYWYKKVLKVGDERFVGPLTFRLMSGDKVAIIGANGIGKSTMLKKIRQELSSRKDLEVGYMPQNYGDVLPQSKNAIEFLTRSGDKEELTAIMTALGSAQFSEEEMYLPTRSLSGGQQAKLFLIQFSLERANVLLLDEPTRNFSPLSQEELRHIFQEYPGTIVTVSHDRNFIEAVCQTTYELTTCGLEQIIK